VYDNQDGKRSWREAEGEQQRRGVRVGPPAGLAQPGKRGKPGGGGKPKKRSGSSKSGGGEDMSERKKKRGRPSRAAMEAEAAALAGAVAKGEALCPGGHRLLPFATEVAAVMCDGGCGGAFGVGSTFWGCRVCNFDLCIPCFEGRAASILSVPPAGPSEEGMGPAWGAKGLEGHAGAAGVTAGGGGCHRRLSPSGGGGNDEGECGGGSKRDEDEFGGSGIGGIGGDGGEGEDGSVDASMPNSRGPGSDGDGGDKGGGGGGGSDDEHDGEEAEAGGLLVDDGDDHECGDGDNEGEEEEEAALPLALGMVPVDAPAAAEAAAGAVSGAEDGKAQGRQDVVSPDAVRSSMAPGRDEWIVLQKQI